MQYIRCRTYKYETRVFTHEDIDFLDSKFQQLSELLGYFVGDLIRSEVERAMKTGHQFMHDVQGRTDFKVLMNPPQLFKVRLILALLKTGGRGQNRTVDTRIFKMVLIL